MHMCTDIIDLVVKVFIMFFLAKGCTQLWLNIGEIIGSNPGKPTINPPNHANFVEVTNGCFAGSEAMYRMPKWGTMVPDQHDFKCANSTQIYTSQAVHSHVAYRIVFCNLYY